MPAIDLEAKKMEIRRKTFEDLMAKLNKYGKCAVIRPTGFGKTWLAAELIFRFKKVLYLYPAEIIKKTVEDRYDDIKKCAITDEDEDSVFLDGETAETILQMQEEPNVTMMTYSKLIRLTIEELSEIDADCIICDECHRIGADKTKFALGRLIRENPKAKLVGLTATPSRMDSFDVVNIYFNDVMTYEYNAHDAFTDGLLQKPHYVFCSYNVEKDMREALDELWASYAITDRPNYEEITATIKKAIVENARICNMENIIKDNCDKYAADTSYMKFIVFFSTFFQMKDKLRDVTSWFKTAYPKHKIKITIVSTETKEYADNVNNLDDIKKSKNTIDLIFCVNMLNVGYHVNDLTGILMYRGTHSNTIYSQQLGRALSSGSNKSGLVFDIVDNIHRLAVYDLNVSDRVIKRESNKMKESVRSLGMHLNTEGVVVDENENPMPFVVENGKVLDMVGNETNLTLTFDGEKAEIICNNDYTPNPAQFNCNKISRDDIIATAHEAEYRELIAKLVAEPISHRCKQVIELHFKKWCYSNNLNYPITNEEIEKLNQDGVTRDDFKKEFAKIVKDNKYDYPIWDAQRLLSIGEAADGLVPLRLFARIKNIQVNTVLDYLELTKPSGQLAIATEKAK